ncbi:GSU2403 family nucleotidyltransferase fold protein [Parvularcula sp. IMCC14364]|uniref:nucleotidyltransferase family protein n=1 Tax=Parvularcula sp. IMCC14364 TaxID=3067902 RepID=UPI002741B6AE|nr:GSU2403 family nucleotidyltransferase fold protein [Parvularcula sp. IMCC14364]
MTISELPLVTQTSYAELIDQLRTARISEFPAGSTFRKRKISGKDYWYVQEPTGPNGRPPERYLGAATAELDAKVEAGKQQKDLANVRRDIVRSLTGVGLPKPDPLTGAILEALASSGVFRLRAVLVGTVAFQTYAGLLGIKLPATIIRTGDLDLAQDYGVSVALDDALEVPLLEVLQSVDKSFQPVPSLTDPFETAAYVGPGGYRVDVLTTNRGADRDKASELPTLKSDATPLRHLDYVLRDPVDAAALTRHGTLISVPQPARYAVHKLIVATMRHESGDSAAKARKDIQQAGILIDALVKTRRSDELRDAYEEAQSRGPHWQEKLQTGAQRLEERQNEILEKCSHSQK